MLCSPITCAHDHLLVRFKRRKTAMPTSLAMSLVALLPQPHIPSCAQEGSSVTILMDCMESPKSNPLDAVFAYGSSRQKPRSYCGLHVQNVVNKLHGIGSEPDTA